MRISKIEITNYRSFSEHVVIDIPDVSHPISIVGHNNSGKTNLISALLHVMGVRSSYPTSFTENDFFRKNQDLDIEILATIEPPLLSTDAYNNVKEMPILKLHVGDAGGGLESRHHCCDIEGKPIFNPRALKRSQKKQYSEAEKSTLAKYQRSGAEQVHKWKSEIPVYYVGPETLEKELRGGRFSLLGKMLTTFKEEFHHNDSTMLEKPGVVDSHVGKTKLEVYKKAISYLETQVLPTVGFEKFVSTVERVLKEQLEIDSEDFKLLLSAPAPDYFYDQLEFQIREGKNAPRLPILKNGLGFVSLFSTALLRAMVDADKGGNIFILEEPESFLHEHYQEYFYRVLVDLSQSNQVILTTHSKKFIDVFEPSSIIRISRNVGESSIPITCSLQDLESPDEIDGFALSSPEDFPKYLRTLEPNLGNIAFSKRVIVVEGPHDLLAYKTVLETCVNLSLSNTSIVAAWGKDTIAPIIQFCNEFKIPVFVIHDSDLENELVDEITPTQKAHMTKNEKIESLTLDHCLHKNVPNLEAVLEIQSAEKGTAAILEKLAGKSLEQVIDEFPNFISPDLLAFIDLSPV